MLRHLKGVVNVAVYNMDPNSADFNDLVKKYKLSSVKPGKPKMRFYPNNLDAEMKVKKSYKVFHEKDAKNIKKVLKQISDGYESATIFHSMQNNALPQLIKKYAQTDKKEVVFVLYKKN